MADPTREQAEALLEGSLLGIRSPKRDALREYVYGLVAAVALLEERARQAEQALALIDHARDAGRSASAAVPPAATQTGDETP